MILLTLRSDVRYFPHADADHIIINTIHRIALSLLSKTFTTHVILLRQWSKKVRTAQYLKFFQVVFIHSLGHHQLKFPTLITRTTSVITTLIASTSNSTTSKNTNRNNTIMSQPITIPLVNTNARAATAGYTAAHQQCQNYDQTRAQHWQYLQSLNHLTSLMRTEYCANNIWPGRPQPLWTGCTYILSNRR